MADLQVELDGKLIHKIHRLRYMDETIPELIEKLVEHGSSCQEWWLERDEDES